MYLLINFYDKKHAFRLTGQANTLISRCILKDPSYEGPFWRKNEKYSKDILLRALNNLWANRIFYRNVLNSTKQNSLNQFARQNEVNALTHFMTIKNVEITERVKFIILYRSYGFINSVHEWVKGNLIFSPEEFADLLVGTMPTYITDLWD